MCSYVEFIQTFVCNNKKLSQSLKDKTMFHYRHKQMQVYSTSVENGKCKFILLWNSITTKMKEIVESREYKLKKQIFKK